MMLYVAKLHKKKILMAYAMKISKIIYIFAHPKLQPFISMNLPKSYRNKYADGKSKQASHSYQHQREWSTTMS